jgi:hypothetical protein
MCPVMTAGVEGGLAESSVLQRLAHNTSPELEAKTLFTLLGR